MAKLQIQMILEILGRPAGNVVLALENIVKKLSEEKGIKFIDKKVHDPKEVENSNGLFTSFAEITAELDNLETYFLVLFKYMPSHIELIEPEKIQINNFDLNNLAGALVQRLHSYDAVTKRMIVERDAVLQKLKEVAPEAFEAMKAVSNKEEPKKKASKKKTKKSSKKTKKSSKKSSKKKK